MKLVVLLLCSVFAIALAHPKRNYFSFRIFLVIDTIYMCFFSETYYQWLKARFDGMVDDYKKAGCECK